MKLLLFFFVTSFCFSQNKNNFYEENKNINLFAFIGEQISIEEFDPNQGNEKTIIEIDSTSGDSIWTVTKNHIMDNAYIAKYKVLESVFNDLKTDTITFVVYDHYGRPDFENYKNILIYISQYENGNYYHQKYQFDPVYIDEKGTWNGIYLFNNVSDLENNLKAKSHKIQTNKFNIDIVEYSKEYIDILFPKPFYEIKNNIAKPILGASISELFRLKKEGVFKTRGFF